MKEQLKQKAFFLDVMNDIMHNKYGIKKIIFSYNSPHAAYTHPWVRIMFPLEGQLNTSISQDNKMLEVKLVPGEILFCLAGGAFAPQPKALNMITIIYWNELIRFLHEGDGFYWYHTNNPINETGQTILKAISLSANNNDFSPEVSHLLNALIYITYKELDMDKTDEHSKSYRTFQHILNYISYNFHKPTNRKLVAEALKITPQHISRLFKMHSRIGFSATVKKMRLNYAMELLHSNLYSVNEIAERSGFVNTGHFITEFKKKFNSTPGKYQG